MPGSLSTDKTDNRATKRVTESLSVQTSSFRTSSLKMTVNQLHNKYHLWWLASLSVIPDMKIDDWRLTPGMARDFKVQRPLCLNGALPLVKWIS
jgi:hypothetical protein